MKRLGKQAAAVVIATAIAGTGAAYAAAQSESAASGQVQATSSASKEITAEGTKLKGETYAKNGFVMIPLREAAEALGYSVKWNKNGIVELSKGNVWTQVQTGVDQYTVNRMYISLGAAPELNKGKLYVPASFVSEVLRAAVVTEGASVVISPAQPVEDQPAAELEELQMTGTITGIRAVDGKVVSVQANGAGMNGIILNIDDSTAIAAADGTAMKAEELSLGMSIQAVHNATMALSLPPQTYASSITVTGKAAVAESTGTEGVVKEVRTDDDGRISLLVSGTGMTETAPAEVVVHVQDDTVLIDKDGEAVEAASLKEGANVLAFYGPVLKKSLPPIGTAWKIVLQ